MSASHPSLTGARPRPGRTPRVASWLVLAAAVVSLSGAGSDADVDSAASDTTLAANVHVTSPGETLPAIEHPFRVGESLKFSVQYGPIHAGSAYLEVPQLQDVGGHPSLVLQARAESNTFFSAFYKVRNRIQSYWDRDGGFSRRYVESRREGGYHAQDDITFDYDRSEARYRDGRRYPIPQHVQDALSSFYFARTQSLP